MPTPEAVRLYRTRLAGYRNRTAAVLVATWDRLDNHNRDDINTYTERTATTAAAAQRSAATLAAAFIAITQGTRPVGVDPGELGVTLDVEGPFHATWHALNIGRPFEEALAVGRSAASASGFDLVQRTARRTGDLVAPGSRWQRIPGPNACNWCLSVARDDYLTAESADFGHERDDCIVVPA